LGHFFCAQARSYLLVYPWCSTKLVVKIEKAIPFLFSITPYTSQTPPPHDARVP
jgi:hypothetical protein